MKPEVLTVYSSAICNLKCKYCFLSKNEAMKKIDEDIEKSFKTPEKYIETIKKYTNTNIVDSIKVLDIWGAEPLFNIERIFPLIDLLLIDNKNFNTIKFSTNLSHNQVQSSINKLVTHLRSTQQEFIINMQISIDGPEIINDSGRGQGVTEKIIDNFTKLIKENFYLKDKDNIKIKVHFKPTIDKMHFDYFLNKKNVINYFQFFEEKLIRPLKQNSSLKNVILLGYPIPNFAIPTEFTKEDGLKFTKMLEIQREIEIENKKNNYFQYYQRITFFGYHKYNNLVGNDDYYINLCNICNKGGGINVLPNFQCCYCHRSFSLYCEEYEKKYFEGIVKDSSIICSSNIHIEKNNLIFQNEDEYKNFYKTLNNFYPKNKSFNNTQSFLLSTTAILLKNLAELNQVNNKYINIDTCLKDLNEFFKISQICISSNIISEGCLFLISPAILKLFFNGAITILIGGDK